MTCCQVRSVLLLYLWNCWFQSVFIALWRYLPKTASCWCHLNILVIKKIKLHVKRPDIPCYCLTLEILSSGNFEYDDSWLGKQAFRNTWRNIFMKRRQCHAESQTRLWHCTFIQIWTHTERNSNACAKV